MLARGDAEGNVVLAVRALQSRLGYVELAVGARTHTLGVIFLLDRLSRYGLNLFLESGWNLLSIFRSHQNARPVESALLQVGLGALRHTRCEDVDVVSRELRYVSGNSHEHACCTQVIIDLDESLRKGE